MAAGGHAVRRAASQPISIIRSTSVPGQLHEATAATRTPLHRFTDDMHTVKKGAPGGGATAAAAAMATSLPAPDSGKRRMVRVPGAPLMVGSLPPVWALEELPELSLGPCAGSPEEGADVPGLGSLSASYSQRQGYCMSHYATSCPAAVWGGSGEGAHHFSTAEVAAAAAGAEATEASLRRSSQLDCLEEQEEDEEHGGAASVGHGGFASAWTHGTPSSLTALSVLHSLSAAAQEDSPLAPPQPPPVPESNAEQAGADAAAATATGGAAAAQDPRSRAVSEAGAGTGGDGMFEMEELS